MLTRTPRFPLFVILALAAGCGGGSDSVSGVFDDLVQTQCQKAFDCQDSFDSTMHNGETFSDFVGGATSVDECITTLTADEGSNVAEYEASVDAGRITFNSGDADSCLDGESAATCDQFFGQNGASVSSDVEEDCANTFVGTVPDGGDCTIDNDCADSDCDLDTMTCGEADS